MFPLYDSIKASRFPFLNWSIVVATAWVFLMQLLAPDPDAFILQYALIPAKVNFSDTATLLPFVTSIFLHGGFLHILSNMWFLIVFGDNVNDELTPFGFLGLYFLAGIVGNLVQYLLDPTSTVPMIGASGAVAGILGCYFVLFPFAKIKTLIFIVFFVTIIDISAPILLGYWFILQIFSGATSLPNMGANMGGIAFFAHIAGFIVGLIGGYIHKKRTRRLTIS
jgi:membrane associated rhomboid family serine protease